MAISASDIILTVVVILGFIRERQYWMHAADQRRRVEIYEKLITRLKRRQRELLERMKNEGENPKPLSSMPHIDSILFPGTTDGSAPPPSRDPQSHDGIDSTDSEQ